MNEAFVSRKKRYPPLRVVVVSVLLSLHKRLSASCAMNTASEYAAIAEGMRLGTLKPAQPDVPPPAWISERFANSFLSTAGPGLAPGFGEQFDSKLGSSIAYSFGNCSRKDAKNVYISKEISKGEDLGPGPVRSNACTQPLRAPHTARTGMHLRRLRAGRLRLTRA